MESFNHAPNSGENSWEEKKNNKFKRLLLASSAMLALTFGSGALTPEAAYSQTRPGPRVEVQAEDLVSLYHSREFRSQREYAQSLVRNNDYILLVDRVLSDDELDQLYVAVYNRVLEDGIVRVVIFEESDGTIDGWQVRVAQGPDNSDIDVSRFLSDIPGQAIYPYTPGQTSPQRPQ